MDQGKGEAKYLEMMFLWISCRFNSIMLNIKAAKCLCTLMLAKHCCFLKQCLAIGCTCSKALPKDYSWDMVQYRSTWALYLGCRTAAGDLRTAQQEAFLHETDSSLWGTSPMLAKTAFIQGTLHLQGPFFCWNKQRMATVFPGLLCHLPYFSTPALSQPARDDE